MKNLLLFGLLTIISCVDAPKPIEKPRQYHRQVYVAPPPKIIKDKREKVETSYGYEFDALNTALSGDLKIRQQPSVATVYYFIFTDGTYRKVSMDEFVVRNIGDTLK